MLKAVFLSSGKDELPSAQKLLVSELKKNKRLELVFPPNKATDKEFFLAQKKLIETADCVIAEVTSATIDEGGQIVYALTKNIPVLALIYKENIDNLSPMLSGNPSENLYAEHYTEDNIQYVLHNFLEHVTFLKNKAGKLVVIDGGDGSGKATQTELLGNYLTSKNIPYKMYDFPRYYSSFHGKTVGRLLSGEFGTLDHISPYLASLAYAIDRASVREEMEDYLKRGGLILCNRYATSNMAHQGGRFENPLKRQEFLKWVYELEYKIHKIPVENIVIYLYVPWQIGFELTKLKAARGYMKGAKLDIHEKDIQHRISSEEMYLDLCKKKKHWFKIDCVKDGKLLSKEEIHYKILDTLKKRDIVNS